MYDFCTFLTRKKDFQHYNAEAEPNQQLSMLFCLWSHKWQLPNDKKFQISLCMDDLQIPNCHPDWMIVDRRLQDCIYILPKNSPRRTTSRSPQAKRLWYTLPKLSSLAQIKLRFGNIRNKKNWNSETQWLRVRFKTWLESSQTPNEVQMLKDLKQYAKYEFSGMGSTPKNPNDHLHTIAKIQNRLWVHGIQFCKPKRSNKLESASNEALRISSGCFISTPTSILQVITEEPLLQLRRDKLNLKYYYRVKSSLRNPAFKCITREQETLYANEKSSPPFAIRILKIHTKFNVENKRNLPDFSYSRQEIKEPTWELPSTRTNLSVTDLP